MKKKGWLNIFSRKEKQDSTEPSEHLSLGFINRLEELVKSSKEGVIIPLNEDNLSDYEAKVVQLMNTAIGNYKTSIEYDIMKYKLTSNALNIALWDMDVVSEDPVNPNNIFTWSQKLRYMLGFSNQKDFPNLLHSWSDQLHPEDKERVLAAFAAHLNDRTGKTPYDIEYRLRLKSGEYRYFYAFGATLRDKDGTPLRVAGAIQDITEKKMMSQTLVTREKMMRALNKTAITLLSDNNDKFEDRLSNGFKPVAEIAGIDRIAVYQLLDGKAQLGQVYLWFGKTMPLDEELLTLPDIPATQRWLETLMGGSSINAVANDLPEDEKKFLTKFGVKTIFMVPIFVHSVFWGVITLEDHTNQRYFDEESLELMRSMAHLFAGTIVRNKMEQEIASVNNYTRAILDSAPIGYAIFDTDLSVIDCNDTIIEILGTTREFYKENFLMISPETQPDGSKSKDEAVRHMELALKGKKHSFEWTHLSTSGELIPFEITLIQTVYNGKNVLQAYQYDLRNIKKMEKAVIETQELMRAITEASPISYVLFNEDMQAINCNEVIMKLLGCKDKQYFLENYWDEFVPKTQPGGNDSMEKAVVKRDAAFTGDHPKFEWVHQTINGELIPMENTLTQVTYHGKKLIISFKYDLRDTRKMLDNISKGSELLKEALSKATLASKAKSEFLSNMSHEMRTPLNAIIGMTAIAKNAKDIERKNYALNKIEDASAHLLGVINDVLDMAKIEANKLELSFIEFNFERILRKTIAVITFRIEEKKQKLTVHIDKNIPEFLIGDDQRLNQIITNLLSNAVKFTPEEGTINLNARLVDEKDDICTISISITDSGIGISEEQKDRLFQSFQQAEASTVRKFGGTGLGLAICKNIVEMMGGKISVESELGKGSTFTFTIQAQRGEGKVRNLRDIAANWDDIRILAVDDDPDILEFFKEISKRYNVHCDTAIDGETALRLVERNGDYNVYFIDWKMPSIDGISLTSALKSVEKKRGNSVVIMISAAEWRGIEDEARKAGVERFLSKPLFPSAVADTICECLGIDRHKNEKENKENAGIFKGHRVLLVEDVEINREIVTTILQPMGLEIDSAENGMQAVKMYEEYPDKYELIFMDVQMPEMDGYDATRCIRTMEGDIENKTGKHRKRIPIIAMTANVFKEDIQKCLDAGMDDHLGKPLDFDDVVEKLKKYL